MLNTFGEKSAFRKSVSGHHLNNILPADESGFIKPAGETLDPETYTAEKTVSIVPGSQSDIGDPVYPHVVCGSA